MLHEAEYAFYWNIFSNSLLARVVNRLPVFFFDQGHMVRAIRPFLNVGMRCYYRGAELPYLDPTQPLEAPRLAERAAWQEQTLRDAVHALQQLPTSSASVESLLRSPVPGAGVRRSIWMISAA